MKKTALKGAMALGTLLLAGTLTACSDRAASKAEDAGRDATSAAEKGADAAGQAAQDAAEATRRAGENAADRTADATRDASRTVGGALENAGRAGDAAMETLDVKTALMADTRVDASGINVDTDHTRKVVVLRGTVPTAAQKTLAGEIATAKAVGYRVENNLQVRS
jgi:osmotically-inducible protein OsmY